MCVCCRSEEDGRMEGWKIDIRAHGGRVGVEERVERSEVGKRRVPTVYVSLSPPMSEVGV